MLLANIAMEQVRWYHMKIEDAFNMPTHPPATFTERGGYLTVRLMLDFALKDFQAAAIVGNCGFESGEFEKLHEIGQPVNLGGYGWAQWTAKRRVEFFANCAKLGRPYTDDYANYYQLWEDMHGDYAYCVAKLRNCSTLEAATFSWGRYFEVPGGTTDTHLPGYDARLTEARKALEGSKQWVS